LIDNFSRNPVHRQTNKQTPPITLSPPNKFFPRYPLVLLILGAERRNMYFKYILATVRPSRQELVWRRNINRRKLTSFGRRRW